MKFCINPKQFSLKFFEKAACDAADPDSMFSTLSVYRHSQLHAADNFKKQIPFYIVPI